MHKSQGHFIHFLLPLPNLLVWIRCPLLKDLLHPRKSFWCSGSSHVSVINVIITINQSMILMLKLWLHWRMVKHMNSSEEGWVRCGDILSFQTESHSNPLFSFFFPLLDCVPPLSGFRRNSSRNEEKRSIYVQFNQKNEFLLHCSLSFFLSDILLPVSPQEA